MTERLVVLLLTGAVGGLIATLVDHGTQAARRKLLRTIAFGLLGFAISVAAVEPFQVAVHLERLETRFGWIDGAMAGTSDYYSAERQAASSNALVKYVAGRRIQNIRGELESLAKRQTIPVAGTEVTNTWRDMVEKAEHCVCATNVVAEKEWSEMSADEGIALQVDAMKRGVTIVRVFLPDKRKPIHVQELRALAERQRLAHIPVYEIGIEHVVGNPSFDRWRHDLNAVDVVVVDDVLALLTQTNPDHEATGATLTSDPETVQKAKEYVLRVLSDAGAPVPARCR